MGRRKKGSEPAYRRHANNVGFVEWQGERIYFAGRYGSLESRTAYEAFCRERVEQPNLPAPSGPVVIHRLLAEYLLHAERHYPPGSEFVHLRSVAQHLSAFAGREQVAAFGPKRLKAFRGELVENTDWSRGYVNRQISRVRRIFRWGVSEELVPVDVYAALVAVEPLRVGRTTAPETQPREPIDDATVDATVPHLSPVVAAMVQFQRLTGVRSENVCYLRPEEIDRTESPWLWTPRKHKTQHTGAVLLVYLGPQAQAVLTPYLDRKPNAYCFSPIEDHEWRSGQRRQSRKTPLTPSQRLRRRRASRRLRPHFDPRSYNRSIRAGIRRANQNLESPLPSWTPHQLRHARGTYLKERYGMEGAQAALGQATMDATQHYTRKMTELAKRIAKESG